MKNNERALLQERVRTLVLRHALEAAFQRIADLTGGAAEDELMKLEHTIVAATRRVGEMPGDVRLAALVAVEDAVAVVRSAFDTVHQRLDAPTLPAALAA
ncbi:hypothetical protein [Methylobacterium sp. Leaf118]|uniref:hypothetical protein n=1 Tax=Methylobacterium sp. Leaf118 TaxID=2876562 RepID=UPI003FA5F6C2